MEQEVFETYESEVRSYCRAFPTVFTKAQGSILTDQDGKTYIDFFNGAGSLNYGHNPPAIKQRLIDYLESDGIIHALDMYTVAKGEFIETFQEKILKPRGFNYKLQFPGPTGTNAVEAALKLARKVTGRTNVLAFMGAFHGMTLGSLALSSDLSSRLGAGVPLGNVTFVPAPYQFGDEFALNYIRMILDDDHSGIDKPAAIVVETTQAEGGVYIFSNEFLRELESLAAKYGILLIVDDIQVGCSRTGNFLSFERAGIHPDMVCMSKSIGGYGLPFSLVLLKPELDIWSPGEHNGTFRGNQLSMIAAKGGVELTLDQDVEAGVMRRHQVVSDFMAAEIAPLSGDITVRGLGMIWGIDVQTSEASSAITRACFNKGLILERAGRDNGVVKIMPSLVIPEETLLEGLGIVRDCLATQLS
ncbi:MAG: diaminobutyrate--2-oxoglutarate transaminase [Propionibacteriaceae bacterium]|nr:diaminobutyrate--2-oxoglutarate transaminase [Propionibacteriaceae bacterium]